MPLVLHLTAANLKMTVRNRQALFWALAFPLMFVGFFALVGSFAESSGAGASAAVIDRAQDDFSRRLIETLGEAGLEIHPRSDETAARAEMADGDLDYLLIIPAGVSAALREVGGAEILLAQASGAGGAAAAETARALALAEMRTAGMSPKLSLKRETVDAPGFDFGAQMLPGLALWGLMSNSVIGVAVALANYREKKILRRIKASPMRARTFFAAQILSFMAISLVQAAMILGFGSLVMGAKISGGLLSIGAMVVICNAVFLNLGYIVGAFSKTASAASGLGNLVVLPLALFSGVFIPTDLMPALIADAARWLPLFPMVEALRGIALGAQPLTAFGGELALIAAWLALTALAAVGSFRFE